MENYEKALKRASTGTGTDALMATNGARLDASRSILTAGLQAPDGVVLITVTQPETRQRGQR